MKVALPFFLQENLIHILVRHAILVKPLQHTVENEAGGLFEKGATRHQRLILLCRSRHREEENGDEDHSAAAVVNPCAAEPVPSSEHHDPVLYRMLPPASVKWKLVTEL